MMTKSENMEGAPLVCICVPTYNAADTIQETLNSLLQQTYANFVIHISDNASTDNTLALVAEIGSERIKIHRHDVNIGGEGNFTRCIQMAEGKYTAIFHADDIYEQNMLAKQVEFLESNSLVGAVFTEATTINEEGETIGSIGACPGANGEIAYFTFPELFTSMLKNYNFLVCPSVMVQTEIYKNGIVTWGGEDYKSSSDVNTWFRLAKIAKIAVLPERLMRYRISRKQFSESVRNRVKPADFFLVLDSYIKQNDVAAFLTPKDRLRYEWLKRHEVIACALNLYMAGRFSEIKNLVRGALCWDAVVAALYSRRGAVTLSGAILLWVLLKTGAPHIGVSIIKNLKNISWRD